MRDFKRIKAWQRAHALAIELHKRTKRFPRAGYARLRAQLTGAADSIKDTIAEGCGAATNKDFARFLDMAIKSANAAPRLVPRFVRPRLGITRPPNITRQFATADHAETT